MQLAMSHPVVACTGFTRCKYLVASKIKSFDFHRYVVTCPLYKVSSTSVGLYLHSLDAISLCGPINGWKNQLCRNSEPRLQWQEIWEPEQIS